MLVLGLMFAMAAAIWLVPLAYRAPTSAFVVSILAVGTILGPPFFSIDGPFQISIDRVLLAAAVGLMTFRILIREHDLPTIHRLDLVLIGLVGWAFLSCFRFGMFQVDFPVPQQPPIARWLFFLACPTALYFVARFAQPSPVALERTCSVLLALGTYLSITAIMEVAGLRSLVFPRFINDPEILEFYGRGRGPLLNPVGNGVFMTVSLSIAAARFFQAGRLGKLGYCALVVLSLAGCYTTLTRSVWMGAALALGIVGWVFATRSVRTMGLASVILFGGAMSMGLKEQLMSFKRDENLSAEEAAKSVELRPLLAIVALEMFADRPLGGHGFGHYFASARPYHTIRSHELPLENVRPYIQHNVFFAYLVDLGLPGVLALSLILGMLAWIAWHMAKAPSGDVKKTWGLLTLGLLSAYCVNGCFHDVSIINMVHMLLFAVAGYTVSMPHQTLRRPSVVADRRRSDNLPHEYLGVGTHAPGTP